MAGDGVWATKELEAGSAQREAPRHDWLARGPGAAYLVFCSGRNFSRWAVNSSRSAQPWK